MHDYKIKSGINYKDSCDRMFLQIDTNWFTRQKNLMKSSKITQLVDQFTFYVTTHSIFYNNYYNFFPNFSKIFGKKSKMIILNVLYPIKLFSN